MPAKQFDKEEEKKLLKSVSNLSKVEGVDIKFHYVDFENQELAELIKAPFQTKELVYLIWHEKDKDFTTAPFYTDSRTNIKFYPPNRHEKFLEDMIIPSVSSKEDFKAKLAKFDVKELDLKIDTFIKRWFVLPEEVVLVLRLFIKFSWVQEQSDLKTYLSIWGDRGTGKTRIGTYLGWLCRFPYFNKSGATPAVLARSLDLVRGVAIIDESDMYLGNTEETAAFMRILKGNESTSTYDVVDEKKKVKFPRKFSVGFPKVILSSKPIKDDHVNSRCITIELKPVKVPTEMRMDTKMIFRNLRKKEAQEIVNDLLIFRLSRFFDETIKPTYIEGIEPRYGDVAQPLFYMIDNEAEHKMFYDFVVKNVDIDLEQRSETNEGQILTCIKKLMKDSIGKDLFKSIYVKVYVEEIVHEIKAVYFGDANERETEKFINARKIGWALKNLGIRTRKGNDGKRFIEPESFDLLESLYRRFGVKDTVEEPVEEKVLTENNNGATLKINNKENENVQIVS
jgi:hypothetical protein